jgi:hypothetical protein
MQNRACDTMCQSKRKSPNKVHNYVRCFNNLNQVHNQLYKHFHVDSVHPHVAATNINVTSTKAYKFWRRTTMYGQSSRTSSTSSSFGDTRPAPAHVLACFNVNQTQQLSSASATAFSSARCACTCTSAIQHSRQRQRPLLPARHAQESSISVLSAYNVTRKSRVSTSTSTSMSRVQRQRPLYSCSPFTPTKSGASVRSYISTSSFSAFAFARLAQTSTSSFSAFAFARLASDNLNVNQGIQNFNREPTEIPVRSAFTDERLSVRKTRQVQTWVGLILGTRQVQET